jgi:hypothetical protein
MALTATIFNCVRCLPAVSLLLLLLACITAPLLAAWRLYASPLCLQASPSRKWLLLLLKARLLCRRLCCML